MKRHYYNFFVWFITFVLFFTCTKNGKIEPSLTGYQKNVIQRFRAYICGGSTRKWITPMKVFVGGNKDEYLLDVLNQTIIEINSLATDGFYIEISKDSLNSNCYIFFGKSPEYLKYFPEDINNLGSNHGYFRLWKDFLTYTITGARIFVSSVPPKELQKGTLKTTLLRLLGFCPCCSDTNTIFYDWVNNQEYTRFDRDLIRLLYHPRMKAEFTPLRAERLIEKNFLEENQGK